MRRVIILLAVCLFSGCACQVGWDDPAKEYNPVKMQLSGPYKPPPRFEEDYCLSRIRCAIITALSSRAGWEKVIFDNSCHRLDTRGAPDGARKKAYRDSCGYLITELELPPGYTAERRDRDNESVIYIHKLNTWEPVSHGG